MDVSITKHDPYPNEFWRCVQTFQTIVASPLVSPLMKCLTLEWRALRRHIQDVCQCRFGCPDSVGHTFQSADVTSRCSQSAKWAKVKIIPKLNLPN